MPRARVIYEIVTETQVSGSGVPYQGGRRGSFRVSLSIGDDASVDELNDIHIEGDARHIVQVLRDALAIVEIVGSDLVEQGKVDPGWDAPRSNRVTEARVTEPGEERSFK